MDDINDIIQRLSKPSNIAIISHRNPDGDAIGSSLAMKLFLEKKNHICKVILPSEYPGIFSYLPKIDDIIIHDLNAPQSLAAIEKAEIICCMDFNSLDRIDPLAIEVSESKAYKLLIDHHIDPEPFADFYRSDTAASSTCELVYRWIEEMNSEEDIDLDIGTCLLTGIITDTGSFKYATNPQVYRIASKLKTLGVDDWMIQDRIFNSQTERQLRLLGHALRNRMEILPELGTGIIYLNKHDYHNYSISRGDTEGLVNYILMIKGMKVAAFIREMPNSDIRLSLRSKGEISVQEVARKHFSGGGHKNASGGSSKLGLKETIQKFKEVIPNYV